MTKAANKINNELTGLEIAVIGMAGRFPGAQTIGEFWEMLKNGIEGISFFSESELEEAGVDKQILAKSNYVKAKAVLSQFDYFDSVFFDYTPTEAGLLDPQVRVFHEVVWEAMEDAGYDPERFQGSIGLYAGAGHNYHWEGLVSLSGKIKDMGEWRASQLVDKDYMSMGISYKLNLTGPAFNIYTACSTSLAAIHLASQSLLNGESDMVLAGGVTFHLPNKAGYVYEEGMIVSPDGHCRTFDSQAKGTIAGNGAGVVLLRMLEEAMDAHDHIYAVIKGTAANNDGLRKGVFTAPAVEGQAEVIRSAMQVAHVEPESIGYLEAHGTATPLGDPIEIEALKLAFQTRERNFCGIGSVKSNIGHLDTAAGVAGFIKAVLSIYHRRIPPTLHFRQSNPEIDFEHSPFYVNTTFKKWENDRYPLRAGVSAFGIGGTNVHVILEEAPHTGELENLERERPYQLLLYSARSETALDQISLNLSRHFQENPGLNLADAAYTLHTGRKVFSQRRMHVCAGIEEAVKLTVETQPGKIAQMAGMKPLNLGKNQPGPVFLFPGQGSQYVGMGSELYREEPVFREEIDRCFKILKTIMGIDLKEILYPVTVPGEPVDSSHYIKAIDQTEFAQPVIFSFQYAVARLLMRWGIQPGAMMGHSIGEFTAAVLAGVYTLEEGLMLVAHRGRLMQQMPTGTMLSVPLSEEELRPILPTDMALAAVNGPALCVVSGSHEAAAAFDKTLKQKGIEVSRLHTSHAFHSPMMDPVMEPFTAKVKEVRRNTPRNPIISNVTGSWYTETLLEDPTYWATQLRNTVRCSEGIKELLRQDNHIFIEIGPGNVLSTLVKKHSQDLSQLLILNLVRHPREKVTDLRFLLEKVGQLWLHGLEIDEAGFYAGQQRRRESLPTYPFERQRYWIEQEHILLPEAAFEARPPAETPHRTPQKSEIEDWYYIPTWKHVPLGKDGEDAITRKSLWLVLMDRWGVGEELVNKLREVGHEVIIVKQGDTFTQTGSHEFIMNPRRRGDYDSLFKGIHANPEPLRYIVQLWEYTGTDHSDTAFAQSGEEYSGFYSLLHLAQAMGNLHMMHEMEIIVVTDHIQEITGDEILDPEKAMVLGPINVIPQEYPGIRCRNIDIDPIHPIKSFCRESRGAVFSKSAPLVAEGLIKEILRGNNEPVVAYRNNRRWLREYEPIKLTNHSRTLPRFRTKGVYLITGGMGEVGLIIAGHLAKTYSARLILTGRTRYPDQEQWKQWLETHDESDPVSRRLRQLQEMRQNGAEISLIQADVSDETQMREAIAEAEQRFGSIEGVIHAAAALKEKAFVSISTLTDETVRAQFRSKVDGLRVLTKVLAEKENPQRLEFCLCMSSIASVLGGLGYTAYSAANCFMDTYIAGYRREQSQGAHWYSVNWDAWETQSQPGDGTAISPEEGIEALERILTWDEAGQVLISTTPLKQRIEKWIRFENGTGAKPGELSPLNPASPSGNRLEDVMVEICRDVLGVEKIEINDNFFDLGANSLDLIQINRRLTRYLNRSIAIDEMFEYPTITTLAKYLSGEKKDETLVEERINRATQRMEHTFQRFKEIK